MYKHSGWDWSLLWSFTLTLYSLDVVSVNISISSPPCKNARTHEGLQSSSRVRRVRSAPRRCSSPDPHHTNINSSLSRPPSIPPSLLFFFQPLFIFQRKKNCLSDVIFLYHLSILPLLSLWTGTGQVSSYRLNLCAIFWITNHFATLAECGTIQTALLILISLFFAVKVLEI